MKKIIVVALCAILMCVSFVVIVNAQGNEGRNVKIEGNPDRLKVEKTIFDEDEPIMVSAVGSGDDWVGIYTPDGIYSIKYFYVRNAGSGKFYNIRDGVAGGDKSNQELPPGKYIIRLLPNGTSDLSRTISSVQIDITGRPVEKPVSAVYVLDNNTDGFASGAVKVRVKLGLVSDKADISMYWANEGGKLKGYAPLAKFQVKNLETIMRIPEGILIPQGATKLLVYTQRHGINSKECVEVELPKNACARNFGDPLYTFNVCSDIHIKENQSHTHNRRFESMLTNIGKNQPDSLGIFVVGDMADSANEREYKNMMDIHSSVKELYPDLPNLYLAIGNHDLGLNSMTSDAEQKRLKEMFCKYAKLPDGSNAPSTFYDFWLNGYHFIFVGNDEIVRGVDTTFSDESLRWLDKTIGEKYSETRPAFIFLHQSLKNTVSGSLDGQGWNGVVKEAEWREILKKYPSSIMFNGHSHWNFDSESNSYIGDPDLPSIFNTASVGYEWSSYGNVHSGGYGVGGSEAYVVDVYKDKVLVRGKEYTKDEWKPSAYYCVKYQQSNVRHTVKYNLNGGRNSRDNPAFFTEGDVIELSDPTRTGYNFDGWFKDAGYRIQVTELSGTEDVVLYAKWTKNDKPDTSADSSQSSQNGGNENTESAKKEGGCNSSLGGSCLMGLMVIPFIAFMKKKLH